MAKVLSHFGRLTFVTIVALFGLLATSGLAEMAAEHRLDDVYVAFLEAGDMKGAYEYIADATDPTTKFNIAYHLMLGSGVAQDECRAISILESLYETNRVQAVSSLNIIYLGSWKSIAFLEGNANAAYEIATYYDNFPREFRMKTIGGEEFFYEKARFYYKLAEQRGKKVPKEVRENYKLDEIDYQKDISEIKSYMCEDGRRK